MSNFVHLHLHTEYSLLDGMCKIKKLIPMIKSMGQTAVAITDHGSMHGVIKFYDEAKKAGIKPIIGCEVYTAARLHTDKNKDLDSDYGHLVLLCKNNVGYQNLIELVSRSNIDGFYYKPRVDLALLEQYHEGIIALSACLAGDIPQKILKSDMAGAEQLALKYLEIFGEGNYYLELQDHGIADQKTVNEGLIKISKNTGIPLVATNDAHYLHKTDAKAQKILVCVQIKKTLNEDTGMGFETDEFYVKTEEEMREIFEFIPEAIDNTQKIADMCNVTFGERDGTEAKTFKLPDFKLPEGTDHAEYLRERAYEGLSYRYTEITDTLTKRLDYELNIISEMGFVDYFLIVWDFIRYAKEQKIPVGPGRGSGAGSLVAYCMRITNIEPMGYNLLFERFLNPERISMPDFDIDFCIERRGEVIDYVIEKYGKEQVAQIVTFGTLKAKAAVKDVGRVLGMTPAEVSRVSKHLQDKMSISESLHYIPDLKLMYDTEPQVKELIDMSEHVENNPRHCSVHAAGIVITARPVSEYVPLMVMEGMPVTQFDMKLVEEMGLLKMDFLGLRNLTVIEDASKLIRKNIPDFDIEKVSLEDSNIFAMLSQGETDGVFQLESGGMKRTLISLKPKSLEDIIAIISLYRPGPMDSIPTYVENSMKDPNKVVYKHPLLKNSLEVTYGCMVYQEQVMQIVRELAGYSYGRADLIRRAMGKKQADVMAKEREYFVHGKIDENGIEECHGAIKKGVPENIANEIFDEMVKFAEYAFNKSHAAAYAFVSYYTAYLRYYFKKEYMAALVTSVLEKTDKMVGYINDTEKNGIKVLPPDINLSEANFIVENDNIRFGLVAIKNVGSGVIADMVKERTANGKFDSFYDFCERMLKNSNMDSKCIESLIRAGAFDAMGNKRRQLELSFPEIRKNIQQLIKEQQEGQFSLFGDSESPKSVYKYPSVEEYTRKELLQMEKAMTGVYISGHPLHDYLDVIEAMEVNNVAEISSKENDYENRDDVKIIGVVSSATKKMTKSEKMMGIMRIQDLTGEVEVLVFSKTYDKFSHLIAEDKILAVSGKLDIEDDDQNATDGVEENAKNNVVKIICNNLVELEQRSAEKVENNEPKQLYIKIARKDAAKLDECVKILMSNKGESEVVFNFIDLGKQAKFSQNNVNISTGMLLRLKTMLGSENVLVNANSSRN